MPKKVKYRAVWVFAVWSNSAFSYSSTEGCGGGIASI